MSERPPDEGHEPATQRDALGLPASPKHEPPPRRDATRPPEYPEYVPGVTEPSHTGAVLRGFAQGCMLHLIQVPLCALLGLIFSRSGSGTFLVYVPLLGIAATQFLYLGPAITRARKRGQRGRVQGLWLCAALTALLSGLCYAAVFWPGRRWAG